MNCVVCLLLIYAGTPLCVGICMCELISTQIVILKYTYKYFLRLLSELVVVAELPFK
ncbi:hypothetical protein [Perigonia lusca single nucleopolyhedrovirus]|uniref:Uncharacterized protein n=1 Tax=Perigonia lusca single nucleopolyhedrovirus TaxID=1675865 RepID=A0A0M3N042_9ABAC|nr:hypothetical protein [Perigonia lusca single nucleopolyhedrovirus]AKN80589.1 hypothetical protein [Perigonia lusca single nucleopolyhedrovirus]